MRDRICLMGFCLCGRGLHRGSAAFTKMAVYREAPRCDEETMGYGEGPERGSK